jgi:hypothetical protein
VFIKTELSTSFPKGIRREKEAEGAEIYDKTLEKSQGIPSPCLLSTTLFGRKMKRYKTPVVSWVHIPLGLALLIFHISLISVPIHYEVIEIEDVRCKTE